MRRFWPASLARRASNYWIVNLVDNQVEVYTDPTPGGYASKAVFGRLSSAKAVPVVIDGVEVGRINVSDILP